MIALDTHVLARFYCDDPNDPEAARQRPAARKPFEQEPALFVPVTVILELEWVMRGFYRLSPEDFVRAMRHLLGLSNLSPMQKFRHLLMVFDCEFSGHARSGRAKTAACFTTAH